LITDSIAFVEHHLQSILEEASRATEDNPKQRAYRKYLRFWTMMELLHKERNINKRLMVVNVFNEYTEELDKLLAMTIVCYVNQKFADSEGKKFDSIFSLLNNSLDSVAITAGSPKIRTAFGLLLRGTKIPRNFLTVYR
jgi:hypothetical protein